MARITVYSNLLLVILYFRVCVIKAKDTHINEQDSDAVLQREVITPPPPLYNKSEELFLYWPKGNDTPSVSSRKCHLRPKDTRLYHYIRKILDRETKLLEYHITIDGYDANPVEINNTWSYKTAMWSRVASSHGQTILNLAFNYGILSLQTLSFGVEKMEVVLEDVPHGCVMNMTELDKVNAILDITMRDLNDDGPFTIIEGQGTICHQVIEEVKGQAKFTDRCCYRKIDRDGVECYIGFPNKWLGLLDVLLAALFVVVFVFGPLLVPDWLYSAALETEKYFVKLKEPLYKTLCVCRRESAPDIFARHSLDLRNKQDFVECRRILSELPSDVIIPIKISRFDIKVNYRKLLPENNVPVGVVESMSKAFFLCKLRNLPPFQDCCDANYTGCVTVNRPRPWISICNILGRILLVFFLPILFYIRLMIYYNFEDPEIAQRIQAAAKLRLHVYYNYRLMQYLTPSHPVFLAAYIIYFSAGITIAYFGGREKKTRFQQAIIDSFSDLKGMSFLTALGMLIRNFLFPFRKYGFFGLFLGVVFWPVFVPMSMVVCFIYCLPIVFLTCRILYHMFGSPKKRTEFNRTVTDFEAENLLKRWRIYRKFGQSGFYCTINCRKTFVSGLVTMVALFTIYAVMLIIAEVVGFVAEILCFTMMGMIVNASKVLKYGTLIFLVIVYSYDTYNNVNKKYLRLNKDLFSEIKKRIKDLEEHTSLPSHLQKNRGFKSCEASEQADYETTDDINRNMPLHWDINDLILFVDSDDIPRIPRKLFDEVCQINVAGSPGPIYKSLLHATGQFLMIIFFLVFVFIVVMSFGDVYKISATNQTLATLAGGFMPFIFSNLLKPSAPEVETGLVSFKSKLEEVIKNFCQTWLMHDFIFDIGEKPSTSEDSDDDSTSSEKTKASTKKDGEAKDKELGEKKKLERNFFMEVSNPLIEPKEIKHLVESMNLESAEGQCVDIVIYVSERDQEWLMEWSSITGMDDTELDSIRGQNSVVASVKMRTADGSKNHSRNNNHERETVLL